MCWKVLTLFEGVFRKYVQSFDYVYAVSQHMRSSSRKSLGFGLHVLSVMVAFNSVR